MWSASVFQAEDAGRRELLFAAAASAYHNVVIGPRLDGTSFGLQCLILIANLHIDEEHGSNTGRQSSGKRVILSGTPILALLNTDRISNHVTGTVR